MTEHEKIATIIFEQHGLYYESAERAGGWTNAVWINGDCVLRLSMKKDSDIIRREVARAKVLPVSVGYPKNTATGVTEGYEWSLSERVNGVPLSSVWGSLCLLEKESAMKQILGIADSVHSVPVAKVEDITLRSAWYNSFDKDKSIAEIEHYVSQKILTPKQGRNLCDILERFYKNIDTFPVLCHGDITADNLLWHNGNVVSLLDFEHSVIAPRQLDVHSLVNLALVPYDETMRKHTPLFVEKNPEIEAFVNNMIALFRPYLSSQSDKDLFMGYNVLFRQRFLEFWLANPEGEIGKCDAYNMLESLCDGNDGYLKPFLSN
jgi:aminoglycoside phosphotransferase